MDGVNKNIQEEKEEKDMPQEETTEESSSAQAEAPKQEETQIEEKDQKPAATEDPASNAAEAEKSTEEQKEELASKGETLQGEEGSESEEGKTEEEDPSVSEDIKRAKKLLAEQDANDPARWYIVHTYSGHENKVAKSINQRVQSLGFEDRIFDIIVPTRNTIKVTQGKKDNVKEFVKLLKGTGIFALCGAGVSTAEDVKMAKNLGCQGVLISSALAKVRLSKAIKLLKEIKDS